MRPRAWEKWAETQRVISESVLMELEVGLTFLDIAETTADRKRATEHKSHAITALRTADTLLSKIQPGAIDLDSIERRREQLAQRLRAILGLARSGGN